MTATANTTGIGSLPHHDVNAALDHSFRMGIPFLPQIPIRAPWECMVAQALESLPGLQANADGSVTLNTDTWLARAEPFSRRLEQALDRGADNDFEPTPSASSCWQPFVRKLGERGTKLAKIQIAGPMTAQGAIELKDSAGRGVDPAEFAERNPGLSNQVFRLILARALAMSRRIRAQGAQPLIFLDEPGLCGLKLASPKHALALQQLRLLMQALREEGAWIGAHCCGETDWGVVLDLPIHYLSIDASLSLPSLLSPKHEGALLRYLGEGGRLALGVIPTTGFPPTGDARDGEALKARIGAMSDELALTLSRALGKEPGLLRKALSEALYTPACGLAFQSAADTERTLASLRIFEARLTGFNARENTDEAITAH